MNNNSCNSSHVHNNSSIITTATTTTKDVHLDDDDEVMLPGFRFHPTDEELVGFYLRRKVEKKPIVIELIKQIDIYKYDPWDLPKISSIPDKEGYFFCKRGRKYRNSIRPNRVTGSGFWKATGIDKPVYSSSPSSSSTADAHGHTHSHHHHYGYHQNNSKIIGLKKTLVYYRGSAGKGTKTDWMMHEFRLPGNNNNDNNGNNNTGICPPAMNKNDKSNPTVHEAEVWTICRIFKRNVSHRKYTPPSSDSRQSSSALSSSNKRSNININNNNNHHHLLNNNDNNNSYISFEAPLFHHHQIDKKPNFDNQVIMIDDRSNYPSVTLQQQTMRSTVAQLINPSVGVGTLSSPPTSFINNHQSFYGNNNDYNHTFIGNNYENNWDELSSVVDLAFRNSSLM